MRSTPLSACSILLALFCFSLPILRGASYSAKAQSTSSDHLSQNGSDLTDPESLPSDRRPPRPPWELPATGSNPIALPPWGMLPEDFVVMRQMPLSSGQREVLMVSSSTRSEQRYLVNLPDTGQFEIYEVAFSNVLMDASKLLGNEADLTPRQAQDLLRTFKVKLDNHALSEIILADGTKAEFQTTQATIKSANGQVLETITLPQPQVSKTGITLARADKSQMSFASDQRRTPSEQTVVSPNLTAQAPLACQSQVGSSVTQLSAEMNQWSTPMTQSSTDVAKLMGWALDYSADAMQNNNISDESGLPDSVCRPPVQCEEKRMSGASEIRTDLFEIPQGGNESTVSLSYEFYTIPDRIEMYYDGRKLFEVGPTSGTGSQQFTLPATGRQIGITLTGNEDPQTRWWYTISCTTTVIADCTIAATADENIPSDLREARRRACRLQNEFSGWKESIDACPCTKAEAEESPSFEEASWVNRWFVLPIYHPGAYTEFRSVASAIKEYTSPTTGKIIKPGQQCAYDAKGNLITRGPAAGTPDAFSPNVTYTGEGWLSENSHTYWDVTPADAMTWQEYHQTWTPNNGKSCPANDGIYEDEFPGPMPVPGPVPLPNNDSVREDESNFLPSPTPPFVPGPTLPPWRRLSPN